MEKISLLFHSVSEKMTAKLTEVVGWSVTTTAAIISGLSIIDMINGVLQTVVLIITAAGGIATYRYIRKKERALPEKKD